MGEITDGFKLALLADLTRLRQICCDPNYRFGNHTQDAVAGF